jgi:hypothetical protein
MRVIKDSNRFDNEQMLLHFGDILDKLKIDKDLFINVEFHGKSIIIDSSLINFIIAYKKLKKKYRLESVTLLEEIIFRLNKAQYFNKDYLKEFFNTAIIEIKLHKKEKKLKKITNLKIIKI